MSVTSGKKKASVRKETVAVSRHETKDRGKMDVAPQACDEQAAADSLCKHLWVSEWHTQGKKGELTSCRGYRPVGVAKTSSETQGGRAELPACAHKNRQGW